MIRQGLSRVSIPIAFLLLATAAVADQSDKQAKTEGSAQLQLPLVGSTRAGGSFSGTVTLQRIEAQASGMVAIGIVRGTLSGAGLSGASTILVTAVTFPVSGGRLGELRLPSDHRSHEWANGIPCQRNSR